MPLIRSSIYTRILGHVFISLSMLSSKAFSTSIKSFLLKSPQTLFGWWSFFVYYVTLSRSPRGALFTLKRHLYDKEWWYFTPQSGCQLTRGLPSSVHGWKSHFFFISLSNLSWGFSWIWGESWLVPNKSPYPLLDDESDFYALLDIKVPPL